ncbi:MAG TPA: hypothetical protein EYN06_06310, partial [Myxococcales bacterium]|nr:hypothetical protein [Myxococcales bacterium]
MHTIEFLNGPLLLARVLLNLWLMRRDAIAIQGGSVNIFRNLLLGMGLLVLMTACNDGPGDIKISEYTSTGRPDSSRTGALSIDESGIVTRYNEQGAVLTIPVETLGGVGKRVNLDVSITGLLDDEGPKGSAVFVLAGGTRLVELLIPGATPTEQQSHQAGKLVRYSAKVAGDDELAFGQRSLYYTLPKIGLRLWAPQRVDAGAQTTVRVWVSDLATGEMLANIPVRSGDQSAITDTAGQALLNVTVPSEGNDFGLIVHADLANITVSSQKLLNLVPAGAPRLFVSTDKPLYRPGQTMHIRALALSQKDLTPIQSTPVILEVLDGKGNKIFKEEAMTDDFGVVSLTAPLASQVNLGDYTIKAVMDDVETGRTVKVSEEKLPKYAVKVDFDQSYFTPGQAVSGVLQARYFFGKAVTGADVKITTDKVGSARVVAFSGTTDQEGLLPFSLDTTGDQHVSLNIEVTDTAGFVVKSVASAAVAKPHLQVQIIPEATQLPNVGPWRFFVTTRGPLGGSIDAECKIVGDDATAIQTGSAGVAVMESASQQVYVSCKAGAMLGSKKQFMPISGNQSAILVRADKAIYRPGEKVELTLVAQNAPDQIYVDRVHRGRIVESRVVSVADGSAQLSMQPTQSERGTIIITAYYLDSNGVAFNAERVVYIQKPFAQVKVTTDKDSYLPGGEAKL